MSLIKQDGLAFKILNGEVYCNSTEIAKEFGKAPSFVMRKIRDAVANLEKLDDAKMHRPIRKYFIDSSYINSQNKTMPRYDLTYLGFQLIALAFTGDKAFNNRLRFINAFEQLLRGVAVNKEKAELYTKDLVHIELREEGKKVRSKLTDAIRDYLLPQRVAENKETSQFVERYITSYTAHIVYKKLNMLPQKGLKVNRDAFTAVEKVRVMDLEDKVADMIISKAKEGIHYKEVYKQIKKELEA